MSSTKPPPLSADEREKRRGGLRPWVLDQEQFTTESGERWWLCDACKAGNCHFCSMPPSRKVCCCVD